MHDLGQERISYGHWKHAALKTLIMWQNNPYWFNSNTYLGKLAGL